MPGGAAPAGFLATCSAIRSFRNSQHVGFGSRLLRRFSQLSCCNRTRDGVSFLGRPSTLGGWRRSGGAWARFQSQPRVSSAMISLHKARHSLQTRVLGPPYFALCKLLRGKSGPLTRRGTLLDLFPQKLHLVLPSRTSVRRVRSLSLGSPMSETSLARATHWSQMKTPGPATSLGASSLPIPQNVHLQRSLGSLRAIFPATASTI